MRTNNAASIDQVNQMVINKKIRFSALSILLVSLGFAWIEAPAKPNIKKIEGTCANGKDHFVMTVHHKRFQDAKFGTMHLYVYEGPLGSGWIRSKVSQDQARAHVCKEAKTRWLPDDETPIDE